MRLEKKLEQMNQTKPKTQPRVCFAKTAVGDVFGLEPGIFFQATKRKRPRVRGSNGHIDYISKSDTMV